MFLNSWSLSLNLCSLLVLVLIAIASRAAVRVLFYWNPSSDSEQQIRLENEIWLASTLVAYALVFQIFSLLLFILAADHYSKIIVGAMCATGSLLANPYGMPTLLVKLSGVFLYGFWIILHKLDITSEKYPLVRTKFIYLILLLPILLLDITLQSLYINGLKPDIITSCCAVVFSNNEGANINLFSTIPFDKLLGVFYSSIIVLTIQGVCNYRYPRTTLTWIYAATWGCFLVLAIIVITRVLSSYVYAMPFHNCPFCLLKPEYHYIGFAMYTSLITGCFFGMAPVVGQLFKKTEGLAYIVDRRQHLWLRFSLLCLLFFTIFSSYHYLLYRIRGGEN